jgi:hypothetical protein
MFKASCLGQKLNDEISKPYEKSSSHDKSLSLNFYSLTKCELFKTCMARELLLMKRNLFVYVFKIVQVMIFSPGLLGWCFYSYIGNHIKLTCFPIPYFAACHHCIYHNDNIYTYSYNCGLDQCQLFLGLFVLYNCQTHD